MKKLYFILVFLNVQNVSALDQSSGRTTSVYQQSPAVKRPTCALVFKFSHNVTAVAPCGPGALIAGTDEGEVYLLKENEAEQSLRKSCIKEAKLASCWRSSNMLIKALAASYKNNTLFAGSGDEIESYDALSLKWKKLGTHKRIQALAVASQDRLVSVGDVRAGSLLKVWVCNKKDRWISLKYKDVLFDRHMKKIRAIADQKGELTSRFIMEDQKGDAFEFDIDSVGYFVKLPDIYGTRLPYKGTIAVVSSQKRPTIEIDGERKYLTLCSDACHFNEELIFLSGGRLLTVDGYHNSQTQIRVCETIFSGKTQDTSQEEKGVLDILVQPQDGELPEFPVGSPEFPAHTVDC